MVDKRKTNPAALEMPLSKQNKTSQTTTAGSSASHTSQNLTPSDTDRKMENFVVRPYNRLYDAASPHKLLIAFDLGTSKIDVASAIVSADNTSPMNIKAEKVFLHNGDKPAPAMVRIEPIPNSSVRRAKLVFIEKAEFGLQWGTTPPTHIFSNLKQCSYLIDTTDRIFANKKTELEETQRRHEAALYTLSQFDEILVVFPSGNCEVYTFGDKVSCHPKIRTVEDVLVIFFRWIFEKTKLAICEESALPEEEFDRLLKKNVIRVGVAVPDVLLTSMVSRYHDLLVRSGFGERIEMLSEARCAAVKVLRDLLDREACHNSLGPYVDKHIDVCDIGHGTTDISTIQAVHDGALLQFKFVADSTGDATGGKIIDDHMIKSIGGRFQAKFKYLLPTKSDKVPIEEDAFVEGFRFGVTETKLNFNNSGLEQSTQTGYSGPGTFEVEGDFGIFAIKGQQVGVPISVLKEAYDVFLTHLTTLSTSSSPNMGLIEKHYSKINDQESQQASRLIVMVGGAAVPRYVQEKIRSTLAQIPITAAAPAAYFGGRNKAIVAEGGVIMLNDAKLSKRRHINEAIGFPHYVGTNSGRRNGKKVAWLFQIGQAIDAQPTVDHTIKYDLEIMEGVTDHTLEGFQYPVIFEWEFARTSDEGLSRIQDVSAYHRNIQWNQGIKIEFEKSTCEWIGWERNELSGGSKLSFAFKLKVELDGNVIRCSVKIPLNGDEKYFGDQELTFDNVTMSANVSHLVHEQDHRVEEDMEVDFEEEDEIDLDDKIKDPDWM